MILGHVTIPIILSQIFYGKLDLFWMLLGTAVPNFDVLPTLTRKETPENPMEEFHAGSILHTPFFYIAISLPLFLLLGFWSAFSFTLSAILHILIDSFDERGRLLLYPFSKKFYGIPLSPYDFWTYITSKKVLSIEACFFFMALFLVILRTFFL